MSLGNQSETEDSVATSLMEVDDDDMSDAGNSSLSSNSRTALSSGTQETAMGDLTNENSPECEDFGDAMETDVEDDQEEQQLSDETSIVIAQRHTSDSDMAEEGSSGSEIEDSSSSEDEVSVIDRKELLRLKQHRVLVRDLKNEISGFKSVSDDTRTRLIEIIEVMEEKYKQKHEAKWGKARASRPHPISPDEFRKVIQGSEEHKHPWLAPSNKKSSDKRTNPNKTSKIPGLVMRAWDEISQCQIKDARVGFLSGGAIDNLDTVDRRKTALARHADWGNRYKTPFISTSCSLDEIENLWVRHFKKRQWRKGILDNTKLTLINTNVRTAAGIPVLHMQTELIHYGITPRYGSELPGLCTAFKDEYLLPYSSGPEEIVGTWTWHDVEEWMKKNHATFPDWYSRVGLPAFQEHERVRLGGTPAVCRSGCQCCGK